MCMGRKSSGIRTSPSMERKAHFAPNSRSVFWKWNCSFFLLHPVMTLGQCVLNISPAPKNFRQISSICNKSNELWMDLVLDPPMNMTPKGCFHGFQAAGFCHRWRHQDCAAGCKDHHGSPGAWGTLWVATTSACSPSLVMTRATRSR